MTPFHRDGIILKAIASLSESAAASQSAGALKHTLEWLPREWGICRVRGPGSGKVT